MEIKDMIEVLQAYERGEQIEYRGAGEYGEWKSCQYAAPCWAFSTNDYRIAPKKQELSLVEELRHQAKISGGKWGAIMSREADRIESLEIANESLCLERRSTDELLTEIRRRAK